MCGVPACEQSGIQSLFQPLELTAPFPYTKTSVIFDPFMYLTLPIPIQVSWDHQVFYVPWNYSESGLSVGAQSGKSRNLIFFARLGLCSPEMLQSG